MKKILFAAFSFVFFAGGAARAVEVHGHRGSRGTHPENTLPAFNEALRAGADVLELDLGVTSDNVLVVSHDQHVNAVICLGPEGKPLAAAPLINSLTFKELKAYDCGSLPNPRFPKQQPVPGAAIPSLAEVFDLVAASKYPGADKVKFNVETKIVPGQPGDSPDPKAFAGLLVDLVRKYKLEDRVIVQSFDYRTLLAAKSLSAKIMRAQLTSENLLVPKDAVNSAKAQILSPYFQWITKETVDQAHQAGIQVIPWTLNEPAEWEKAVAYGVDGIITDYPADLVEFLKSKKLR